MPITMMTSKTEAGLPNVVAVPDYHGHRHGELRHPEQCPNAGYRKEMGHAGYCMSGATLMADKNEAGEWVLPAGCFHTAEEAGKAIPEAKQHSQGYYAKACSIMDPLYMKTTHVGMVIQTGEHNGYDDSDFYAIVYLPETDKFTEICYASTRGWTYPNNAQVDAPPELIERYHREQREMYEFARRQSFEAKLKEAANTPAKGMVVIVARGRKVPQGIVGEVFWTGEKKISYNNYQLRLGLTVAGQDEKVWIDARNVDILSQHADDYALMMAGIDPHAECALDLEPGYVRAQLEAVDDLNAFNSLPLSPTIAK